MFKEMLDYITGGGDVKTEVSLEQFETVLSNWDDFQNELKAKFLQYTETLRDEAAEAEAEEDEELM